MQALVDISWATYHFSNLQGGGREAHSILFVIKVSHRMDTVRNIARVTCKFRR